MDVPSLTSSNCVLILFFKRKNLTKRKLRWMGQQCFIGVYPLYQIKFFVLPDEGNAGNLLLQYRIQLDNALFAV